MTETVERQTWWQGNSTRLWRLLVLAMWALLLFFGQREIRRIDTMQERQAQIRSGYAERAEIAEINKRMQLGFDRLSDQIAEINRYLRNKGGG